jgi:hypothetical protein
MLFRGGRREIFPKSAEPRLSKAQIDCGRAIGRGQMPGLRIQVNAVSVRELWRDSSSPSRRIFA